MNKYKLIDCFYNYSTTGLFKAINTIDSTKYAWASSNTDIEYFMNHSGDKICGPIISKLIATNTGTTPYRLTSAQISQLAQLCVNKFGVSWQHDYALLSADYDPIENYSMVETEKTKNKQTSSANTSVYGFNSTDAVPQGASEGETSGLNTDNQRDLTRSGNIGVTTSQQMIQSEIDLWQWHFLETVFADVDSLLALKIYNLDDTIDVVSI